MRALDAKEMESSPKIEFKNMSWWMFIKDAYKLGVLIIAKLSKNKCVFLAMKRKLSQTTQRHD